MKRNKGEVFNAIAKITTLNVRKGEEYELVPEIASINHNGEYSMRIGVYIGETFIMNVYSNEELTETFDIPEVY